MKFMIIDIHKNIINSKKWLNIVINQNAENHKKNKYFIIYHKEKKPVSMQDK